MKKHTENPEYTDREKKQLGAATAGIAVAALTLVLAVSLLLMWEKLDSKQLAVILVVYVVIYVAVAVGVIVAMIQRLRELKKGEEDEAKKY